MLAEEFPLGAPKPCCSAKYLQYFYEEIAYDPNFWILEQILWYSVTMQMRLKYCFGEFKICSLQSPAAVIIVKNCNFFTAKTFAEVHFQAA